jgi:hypothetical protein
MSVLRFARAVSSHNAKPKALTAKAATDKVRGVTETIGEINPETVALTPKDKKACIGDEAPRCPGKRSSASKVSSGWLRAMPKAGKPSGSTAHGK